MMCDTIVGFTITVVNDSRQFLSQFSTNFHEILHTLISIHVVTTLKVLINILEVKWSNFNNTYQNLRNFQGRHDKNGK